MAPRTKATTSSSNDDSSDEWYKQFYDEEEAKNHKPRRGKSSVEKGSDEYRRRRERNNIAVKKSRNKTKQKTQETLERVNQLKAENEMLETKIKLLTKELSFLKDLFLAHAGSAHGQTLTETDLGFLKEDNQVEVLTIATKSANNEAIQNDHKYTNNSNLIG